MIFIKNLTKITDTKYSIGNTWYSPFDQKDGYKINSVLATKEQMEQEGKLLELPGKLADVAGKEQVLYYNPSTNTCFYEYIDIPVPQSTQLETLSKTVTQLTLENADLKTQVQTLSQTVAKLSTN